jgi:hypothetical protein
MGAMILPEGAVYGANLVGGAVDDARVVAVVVV